MADKYYTITASEDGGVFIHEYDTKEKLLEEMADDGGYESGTKFLPIIPNMSSENWKEDQGIIIKGEIVVPKPKEVVKEWDII